MIFKGKKSKEGGTVQSGPAFTGSNYDQNLETLEVHEMGASTSSHNQEPRAPDFRSIPFSRRKAIVVSSVLTGVVLLFTGVSSVFFTRTDKNRGENPVELTSDLTLRSDEKFGLPAELQGSEESLVIKGDIITQGVIKISNGGNVMVVQATNLTANRTFSLPDVSGTFCTDANNCNYAGLDQLGQLNTQVAQLGQQLSNFELIADSGVTSVNNQTGVIAIQGSANRILVNTAGGVITLSTPQELDANANVQFGSLTVSASGVIRANNFTQTGAGNNVSISAGSDAIMFTAGGRTFQLPVSGPGTQTICTDGALCATGAGEAVLLSDGAAQTDTDADASIFINDTGGGHLIRLQSMGVDRLAVDNNGNTTVGGSLTVSALGNGFVRSTAGALSVVSAIDLASSDVTNTLPVNRGGTGAASLTANGVLVGNGTSPVSSVAAGGSGLCLVSTAGAPTFTTCPGVSSLNGQSGSLTLQGTANQVSVSTAAGVITLSTPQDINTSSSPTFAALTLSGLSNGVVRASAGTLTTGLVSLTAEVSGTLPVGNGGTGTATTPTNGQLLIGNGTNYTLATLTQGAGMVITNGAGSITIASAFGSSIDLGSETTGDFVASVSGSGGVNVTGGTGAGSTPSLSLVLQANKGLEVDGNGLSLIDCGLNQILKYNGSNQWACAADETGSFTIAGDSGTAQNVANGDTVTIQGGTNISTSAGATDTITINTVNNPTFTASVTTPLLQSSGALTITPNGALTVGATGQTALLQGSTTTITSNGLGNDIVLSSADQIRFSGFDCTAFANGGTLTTDVSGNISCADDNGAAANTITGTGTANRIALYTGSQTIADSWLLQNGSTLELDNTRNLSLAGGNFSVTGTGLFTGLVTANGGLTIEAGDTFTFNGEAFTDLTGTGLEFSSGALQTTLGTSVDLTTEIIGILPVANGGTGVNGSTAANGTLLIGNGTGFTVATLTAGSGITVNNSAGGIEVVNVFGTSIESGEITDLTITNADIANGTIDISTKTTGNFVATVSGSSQISVSGSGSNNAAVALGIVADSIGDTQLAFDTGQNLTTTSSPSFNGLTLSGNLTVQGGNASIGTATQAGSLTLSDGSSNTGALQTAGLGQNTTFTLPDPGAATATICLDTGNCAGVGGGVTTAGGTANRIAIFNGAQTIADSWLLQNGSTLQLDNTRSLELVGGNLTLTSGNLSISGNQTTSGTVTFSGLANGFLEVNGTGVVSVGTIDLGADTTGNYVATITAGNGISGTSNTEGGTPTIALSNLTADWIQSGAFDIVLGNAGSEIRILESVGGTFYGTFDVGDLSADQTYTFLQGGDVLTSGNVSSYATTGVTAGNGLTGGGTTGLLTVNIGAGNGIQINADDIAVVYGSTANTAVEGDTQITVTAGTNLTGGGTITLGAGGSLTVNVADSPTFAGNVTVQGGGVTVGAATQAGTVGLSDGSSNTGTLQTNPLAQNTAFNLPDPGQASADICLSTGNCAGVGGGVTTAGGTANRIAMFNGSQTIADSWLLQNGSTLQLDNTRSLELIGGNLTLTSGNLSVAGNQTTSGTVTFSALANGFLEVNGSGVVSVGTIDLGTDTTGNYVATITAGNGISGTATGEGSTPTIALGNLTADWVQSGAFDIVLDNSGAEVRIRESNGTFYGLFDVGDLTADQTYTFLQGGTVVTSGNVSTYATTGVTAGSGLTGGGTTGLLTVNIGAGNGIQVNADDIAVIYGSTANTAVQGNTQITVTAGTNLTGGGTITLGAGGSLTVNVADSPTFAGTVNVQGATLTIGTGTQQGSLVLNDGSTNTGTLQTASLGQNTTFTLPDPGQTAADICLSTGNCAGAGNGITGSGTQNSVAKFGAGGDNITDSTLTDDGTNVTTSVDLIVQGGSATIGTALQNGALTLYGNGFTGQISGTFTANRAFTLPDGTGEFCIKELGNCSGSGGGNAPENAQYLVLALDAGLSAERTLSFSSTNFTVVDNGANNSYTVNTAQNIATTSAPSFAGLTLTGNLNLNANTIQGTTAVIDFNNFDVASTGAVTAGTYNGQTISSSASFTGTLTVAGLTTLNGGLNIEAGDTLTFNGDAFTDLTGNGLQVTTNVLTLAIQANKGLEVDANGLSLIDCLSGEILKYNGSNQWACATDTDTDTGDNTSVNGVATTDLNFINVTATGTETGTTWTLNAGATPDEVTLTVSNASATQAGSVTTGAQTFAGAKTFNGSVTVAAQQTITMVGGTTAQRPASPTEGMLFFDTTTKQLLTYANGKWNADRGEYLIVAASNSPQAIRDAAHYLADGNTGAANDGDQIQINQALTAAAGGKVYLAPGTYVADATILIPNNTTLAGAGRGTLIELADIDTTDNLIENLDTTATAKGLVVQDFRIDGRSDLNTAGTQHGVFMGTGGFTISNATVKNLDVSRFRSRGIYIDRVANIYVKNNIVSNNGGIGIYVNTSDFPDISGNTSSNNGDAGIHLNQSYFDAGKITGNIANDNTGAGFIVERSDYVTFTGNLSSGNTGSGLELRTDTYSGTFSSNTFSVNGGDGVLISGANTGYNVISGNNIIFNTGYGINVSTSGHEGSTITGNRIDGNGLSGIRTRNYSSYGHEIIGNSIERNSEHGIVIEDNNGVVMGNNISENGTSGAFDSIRIANDDGGTNYPSNARITNNAITDSAGTGYAINIPEATTQNTYLSGNTFSGAGAAGINDNGTNTIYEAQKSGATGTDFTIQAAGTVNLLSNASITGNLAVSGTSTFTGLATFNGNLRITDGSSNYATITVNALAGDYSVAIPTITANDTICLVALGNCAGSGGGITGSGTNGRIAYFNGSGSITDSVLVQSSGNLTLDSGQNFVVADGNIELSGNFNLSQPQGDSVTRKITGRFNGSVAGINPGAIFESHITNGSTTLQARPNGTGTGSGFLFSNVANGQQQLLRTGVNSTSAYFISDHYLNSQTGLPITFSTKLGSDSATERLRVTAAGLIGIGTTAPASVLEVQGNLSSALTGTVAVTNLSTTVTGTGTAFTSQLNAGDSIKIGTEIFTVSSIESATSLTLDSAYQGATASGLTAYRDNNLLAVNNGDGVNKLTVTRSGRVGIGTTSPSTTLHVSGATSTTQLFVNATSNGGGGGSSNARLFVQQAESSAGATFKYSGTEPNSWGVIQGRTLDDQITFRLGSSSGTIMARQYSGQTTVPLVALYDAAGTVLSGFNSGGNLFYTNSGFTSTISSTTLTANRSIIFPDSAGIVCLDSGNCNGAGATLQTAYNNSTSPATITTTSAAKNLVVKSGVGFNSTTAFQVIPDGTTTATLSVDTTNNRVGIGTASPSSRLTVAGGDLELAATTGQVREILFSNVGGGAYPGTGGAARIRASNGDFYWQGAGGSAMQMGSYHEIILSGGRNTTSILNFVTGNTSTYNTRVINSGSGTIGLTVEGSAGQTADLQRWLVNGTSLLRVTASGALQGTNGSGTDVAGSAVTVAGGQGTGTGAGGSLLFQTAAAGLTGTTLNPLTTRMEIQADGDIAMDTNTLFVDAVNNRVGIGIATPDSTLNVNGTAKLLGGSLFAFNNAANDAFGAILNNGGVGASQLALQAGGSTRLTVLSTGTIQFNGYNCTTFANGGVLTTDASGNIACADDDGGGAATTLQQAYSNDTDGSDAIIALSAADDSIVFRNPSSGGTDSGYVVSIDQLSTGNVDGLRISSAGTGSLLKITDSTATSQDVLNIADGGAATFRNQTNSAAAFQIQNAAGNSNLFIADTTNNQIGIGIAPGTNLPFAPKLHIADNGFGMLALQGADGTSYINPELTGYRSRGTLGAMTSVVNGDELLEFVSYAFNGSSFLGAGGISIQVDGDPNTAGDTTDIPSRIVFFTTPDGSGSPTEKLRIDNAGNVGIGATGPSGLQVNVPVSETARGSDNIRFGVASGTPRIILEDNTFGQWEIDNSNGTLRFYQPGQVYMSLTSTGLGLGPNATNPAAKLHVDGTIRFEDFINCSALETNASGDLVCGTDDAGAGAATLQSAYNTDTDGGDSIISLTSADDSIIFRNPAAGGSDSTFVLKVEQLNTGAVDGLVVNHAGTGYAFRVNDDGTDTDSTPFVVTANGKVGIGTTTPNANLEVVEANSAVLADVNTYAAVFRQGTNGIVAIGGDANYGYIQSFGSRPLQINNQGNDVLMNAGGGNVGIGLAASDSFLGRLDVRTKGDSSDTILAVSSGATGSSNAKAMLAFRENSDNNYDNGFNIAYDNSNSGTTANRLIIQGVNANVASTFLQMNRTTGNIGIGVADSADHKLYVDTTNTSSTGNRQAGIMGGMTVNPSANQSAGAERYGLWGGVTSAGANTKQRVVGVFGDGYNTGSGTINELYGMYGMAYSDTSAVTINNMAGVYGHGQLTVSGSTSASVSGVRAYSRAGNGTTVTDLIGLHVTDVVTGTATVTNRYGLKIDSFTTGTAPTNDYGIWQGSSSVRNYLAGNLGVGMNGGTLGKVISAVSSNSTSQFLNSNGGLAIINTDQTANNWASLYFGDEGTNASTAIQTRFTDHTNNYGDLLFSTNASGGIQTRMTILSGGNVGIGNANPQTRLHVSSGAQTAISVGSTEAANGYSDLAFRDDTSNTEKWSVGRNSDTATTVALQNAFYIYQSRDKSDASVSQYRFLINDSGNVGIGTASPGSKLHLFESGNAALNLQLQRSNNAYDLSTTYTPSGALGASNVQWYTGMYSNENSYSIWSWNGTSAGRALNISNTANVGIGVISPEFKLQVAGAGNNFVSNDAYAGIGVFQGRRANGTQAAPTALGNNEVITQLSARGHDGSAWSGTQAAITLQTIGAWTGTSKGTAIRFQVTDQSTTTLVQQAGINSDGSFVVANGDVSSDGARMRVVAHSASTVGTIIQGTSGQTADILKLKRDTLDVLTVAGTGAVVMRNSANSTDAFQVQNASSQRVLGVNTTAGEVNLGSGSTLTGRLVVHNSTNNNTVTLTVGATSTSYTLTLPTSVGSANQCLQNSGTPGVLTWGSCGGGASTKTIKVLAEYAGGILSADGTSNTGTMSANHDSTARRNYYEWTTTQGTAQDYDVVATVQIPSDFTSIGAASGFKFFMYDGDGATTTAKVTWTVVDGSGTQCFSSDFNGAATNTWEQKSASTLGSCTFSANSEVTFRFKLTTTSGAGSIRIGGFEYQYSN